MVQRLEGLPSPDRVIELLGDEFTRAGYEIEDVVVDARTSPPTIRVVADGDVPPDLAAVSELSRAASALLDSLDTGSAPYLLEVSSPGVDRPLTAEKHFRRARARRVEVTLGDGAVVRGAGGRVQDEATDRAVAAGNRHCLTHAFLGGEVGDLGALAAGAGDADDGLARRAQTARGGEADAGRGAGDQEDGHVMPSRSPTC